MNQKNDSWGAVVLIISPSSSLRYRIFHTLVKSKKHKEESAPKAAPCG